MGTIKDRYSMDLTEAEEIKKRCANFSQVPQEEPSLRNRYVRWTLVFSASSAMDPEMP